MTPDEARTQPGAFTAYRRTDGEPIYGEFVWLSEHFECGDSDWEEPYEVEEVIMVPVRLRVFQCHTVPDPEPEDTDA